MNYSCAIQHHPSRDEYLNKVLLPALGKPEPHVIVDEYSAGIWASYQRCLLWGLEQNRDYVLVLQDDIYPCKDFLATVQAVTVHKSPLLTFFTPANHFPSKRPMHVDKKWYSVTVVTGQALCWPIVLIPEFLAWCDSREGMTILEKEAPKGWNLSFGLADMRAWVWARETGKHVKASYPSLVEHVAIRPNQTLNTRIARGMQAAKFWGMDRSGLEW